MAIPDSLQARIDLFRENAHAYQDGDDLFRVDSWVQVLMGQRLQPKSYHHLAQLMPPKHLDRALGDLKSRIDTGIGKMPSHQAFLESYCGAVRP